MTFHTFRASNSFDEGPGPSSYDGPLLPTVPASFSQTGINYTNFTAGDTWLVRVTFSGTVQLDDFEFNVFSGSSTGKLQIYDDDADTVGTFIEEVEYTNTGTGTFTVDMSGTELLGSGTYWIGPNSGGTNWIPYAASPGAGDNPSNRKMFTNHLGYYDNSYHIYYVLNFFTF